MTDFELINVDPEDIDDLLARIQRSFNIKFIANELTGISTFGELCDHITNKIQLEHVDSCTTQQAFYKLRYAIKANIVDCQVAPGTSLTQLFPRQGRRSMIKKVEYELGCKLSVLRPKYIFPKVFGIILFASLVELFFERDIGMLGIVLSSLGLFISNLLGKEFKVTTISELVVLTVRKHYMKSRRNPLTFNRNEIEGILTDWFSEDLYLDKSVLTKDAKLQ